MQVKLEKTSGFQIIPFELLHNQLINNLNQLLKIKHGASKESGWEVHKLRLQHLATILINHEGKYSKSLELLPPKAVNDSVVYTRDYILTAAAWECFKYIESKGTYLFPATNSVMYTALGEWLGLLDKKSKPIIENQPTLLEQRQMYTCLSTVFNHLVFIGGSSNNGFLPAELSLFAAKETIPYLQRLSEGKALTEKDCASDALIEHQKKEERNKQHMASEQSKVSPVAAGFWQPVPYNNLNPVNPELQLPPTGEPSSTMEGSGLFTSK